MEVLRVELEAPVCSFRYPHFLVGRQLSFDMPPPATIYGHIASAVGDFPDPRSFRFAYCFSSLGKCPDLESQHIVTPGRSNFKIDGNAFPTSVNATVQPTVREFLFGCSLTLYLDRLDFEDAFRYPRFPVVLGRSQDLACYTRIDRVSITTADRGYFEHTILPAEFRRRTGRGITVLMPRFVSPPPMRETSFDRFIVLRERIYDGPPGEHNLGSRQMLRFAGETNDLLTDPESPEWRGAHRALAFHSFS
jgi:CRISPR-associated protein Cas5t